MTIATETVIECRDCSWQPDPSRRMGLDRQAEEHTKNAGHVTVSRTFPVAARPALTAGAGAPVRSLPVEPDPPARSGAPAGAQQFFDSPIPPPRGHGE